MNTILGISLYLDQRSIRYNQNTPRIHPYSLRSKNKTENQQSKGITNNNKDNDKDNDKDKDNKGGKNNVQQQQKYNLRKRQNIKYTK